MAKWEKTPNGEMGILWQAPDDTRRLTGTVHGGVVTLAWEEQVRGYWNPLEDSEVLTLEPEQLRPVREALQEAAITLLGSPPPDPSVQCTCRYFNSEIVDENPECPIQNHREEAERNAKRGRAFHAGN